MFSSLLAALAALSIAAEPQSDAQPAPSGRLAVVLSSGAVLVSQDHGQSWTSIAQCNGQLVSTLAATADDQTNDQSAAAAPATSCAATRPPAHLAWHAGVLYLACDHGSLLRWQPERGLEPVELRAAPPAAPAASPGPEPAAAQPLDRIAALGSGQRLWLADAHGGLWFLDAGRLSRASTAPEPVRAMTEADGQLVIAGSTAVWRSEPAWQPVITVRACALLWRAQRLWLAGPDGLVSLDLDGSVSVHGVEPLTGLASSAQLLWLANGQLLRPVPLLDTGLLPGAAAQPELDAPMPPRVDWADLARRARWAALLPRVTLAVSCQHQQHLETGARSSTVLAVWLWLSWSLDDGPRNLDFLQRSAP